MDELFWLWVPPESVWMPAVLPIEVSQLLGHGLDFAHGKARGSLHGVLGLHLLQDVTGVGRAAYPPVHHVIEIGRANWPPVHHVIEIGRGVWRPLRCVV